MACIAGPRSEASRWWAWTKRLVSMAIMASEAASGPHRSPGWWPRAGCPALAGGATCRECAPHHSWGDLAWGPLASGGRARRDLSREYPRHRRWV